MRVLVYLNWPARCFRACADDIAFLKGLLPRRAEVVVVKSDAAFLRELPTASHVITWHFRREWYESAKKLRVLATPSAGRELINQDAPSGVQIHFGHFHGAIISEAVVGFILAWAHGFFAVRAYAGYGGQTKPTIPDWPRAELGADCYAVAGTRAAVVGYGHIGRTIGEKLAALGVQVKGYRRANISELDADLKNIDWLVLALPGDTGTDNLLSKARLATLPRRAVVINIGRGNAIDEDALLAALRSRRLAAAYLDVFQNEPSTCLIGSDPIRQVRGRILGTDPIALPTNLIRMPHSSAFSRDYLKRCFKELKDDGCL